MPLYTDPGYSYYSSSGGGMYSPYYSNSIYSSSSSSSSPYAPYSSTYNRSYNGTYTLPSTSRSAQYTALVSRYQPKLSTITESPLTSRANFIPLTRIQSPKISTYTPVLSSKYISSRPARPKTINTADIDVSASSRYGRHHHMDERQKEEDKAEVVEEVSAANTDSDASSSIVDPNSPFMPRVDGTDTGHHARSTIKRNRAVVRLSMMRSRSKKDSKADESEKKDPEPEPVQPETAPVEKTDPLERFYIHDKAKEDGLQVTVTDMIQSQSSETAQNELIIEVDPITHTVRRLSIPQVPSFHDICEDISSDKIDDDLNAGVLRRRASLIQEQEIEILNELQKSQSGSIQVIHLERNTSQEDCRKSRKSKKTKKIRHKITANVEIENSPLTPVIQQTIAEEASTTASPTLPKFSFNIEDIEEHKVFKLPKKRVKSVKSKKASESVKSTTEKAALQPAPPDKEVTEEPQPKVATPKPIRKIEKSESSEDFWSQIGTRETLYMNKRKKILEKSQSEPNPETDETPQTPNTPLSPKALHDEPPTSPKTPLSPTDTESKKPATKPPSVLDLQSPKTGTPSDLKSTTKPPTVLDDQPPASPKTKTPAIPSETELKKPATKPPALDKSKLTSPDKEVPKKDPEQPTTPKKTAVKDKIPTTEPSAPKKTTTTKSQDSPKSKNVPKLAAKKKSSPKTDAKEETTTTSILDSNSKPKAKPSASTPTTTNEESISSPKIDSGSTAKSPEKKKILKTDKQTKNASPVEITSKPEDKKSTQTPETISAPSNKKESPKQELQKPLTPTSPITDATTSAAKSDYKPPKTDATSPTLELSSAPSPSPATPETQSVTSPLSSPSPSKPTADVQVSSTTTASSSPPPPTKTKPQQHDVLGSGNNNLTKFATVSNLAQYLLDVDAEVADYIPSSAEETDSSSDSYIEDGSLSASMKKKNKQLRKKAKEEQQAFDPNKKIKIDTKKKCYVKEEAPRYPLVATPRPLWKREKVVYEESSNSSSEETDSESECTTSDEYEDELSPKDTIIRMSTCSNDSGFDGGTAPSSSKKALDCDVNCHKKCEKLTANLCGVKQKLIVEALACVKRGTQEARDSPCSPLSLNPAYKIEANDDETSYTYLQFQKSGRITAPATTIPRFKKYSVEDFHFLAVLGKGSFGKVLLAELRNTDFYYAVKCLKKDVVLEDDDVECTLIERKVLALGTKHPYLCHLFCTFQTESHLFFVMEYLNGGDLMFHIQESGRFPEDRARFYGAEIISGLKFLHKKGIIYRDLKLDNVLLDFDGHVRIADFGMCKLQIYLDKTADSFCGTPDYMAPEIIKGDKYNQNVDWWSFGVLLYEMLIGQSPFSGCDEDELFWSICNEIPWFPVYITQEATSILKGLLEKDYTRRVGSQYSPAGDICDHIFFKDIDWGLLEKRQLPPPFKPQVVYHKHPLDTQYFDRAFTRERVRLTPIDKEILQSMDQEQFQGFSYTNPNATLD